MLTRRKFGGVGLHCCSDVFLPREELDRLGRPNDMLLNFTYVTHAPPECIAADETRFLLKSDLHGLVAPLR